MSDEKPSESFWRRVDIRGPDECWPWMAGRITAGYGGWRPDSRRLIYAHRFAWEDTHGPIPKGKFICHRCDNPPCCNPAHLWLGTCADNNADRDAKGRSVAPPTWYGEAHPNSKLTEAGVTEIRRLASAGRSAKEIAASFGTSVQNVSLIVRRRTWTHVP